MESLESQLHQDMEMWSGEGSTTEGNGHGDVGSVASDKKKPGRRPKGPVCHKTIVQTNVSPNVNDGSSRKRRITTTSTTTTNTTTEQAASPEEVDGANANSPPKQPKSSYNLTRVEDISTVVLTPENVAALIRTLNEERSAWCDTPPHDVATPPTSSSSTSFKDQLGYVIDPVLRDNWNTYKAIKIQAAMAAHAKQMQHQEAKAAANIVSADEHDVETGIEDGFDGDGVTDDQRPSAEPSVTTITGNAIMTPRDSNVPHFVATKHNLLFFDTEQDDIYETEQIANTKAIIFFKGFWKENLPGGQQFTAIRRRFNRMGIMFVPLLGNDKTDGAAFISRFIEMYAIPRFINLTVSNKRPRLKILFIMNDDAPKITLRIFSYLASCIDSYWTSRDTFLAAITPDTHIAITTPASFALGGGDNK